MLGGDWRSPFPLTVVVCQTRDLAKGIIVAHQCEAPKKAQFAMANNFGYFDESGKFADQSIVAFCGLMNTQERWEPFKHEWEFLLRRNGISSLHMSKGMLNFKIKMSAKRPALGRPERIKVLGQFVKTIKEHVELGVVVDIDINAYRKLKSNIQQKWGDPYLLAFRTAFTCVQNGTKTHHRLRKPNSWRCPSYGL
jgi:hypothetical protein